jgi:hypothetical protein
MAWPTAQPGSACSSVRAESLSMRVDRPPVIGSQKPMHLAKLFQTSHLEALLFRIVS